MCSCCYCCCCSLLLPLTAQHDAVHGASASCPYLLRHDSIEDASFVLRCKLLCATSLLFQQDALAYFKRRGRRWRAPRRWCCHGNPAIPQLATLIQDHRGASLSFRSLVVTELMSPHKRGSGKAYVDMRILNIQGASQTNALCY